MTQEEIKDIDYRRLEGIVASMAVAELAEYIASQIQNGTTHASLVDMSVHIERLMKITLLMCAKIKAGEGRFVCN